MRTVSPLIERHAQRSLEMDPVKLRKIRLKRRREVIIALAQACKAKYPTVFGEGGMNERDESEFALSQHQIRQYNEARAPIPALLGQLYSVNRTLGYTRRRLNTRGVDVSAVDITQLTAEFSAMKE